MPCLTYELVMIKLYEIIILDEAFEFLKSLDKKHYKKILFNIRRSQYEFNPKLLKKLSSNIWELRTLYSGIQYRLLVFWDKRDAKETLIVATHGFIKKSAEVPVKEIEKAEKIRNRYLFEID